MFISFFSINAYGLQENHEIMGIKCESMEHSAYHIHTHLLIFIDGRSLDIPANIGISLDDNCLYWLHTHQNDGIIHIESPTNTTFTLGQFFAIWNYTKQNDFDILKQTLSKYDFPDPLVYINGNLLEVKDIFLIPLRDGDEIKLVYGNSSNLKSYFVFEKKFDSIHQSNKDL
ncbi:MAG: hypothetical protein ACPKPY_09090 [Nitrososphaeraceae archaeon]